MKGWLIAFSLLLNALLVSAYIDPGTGNAIAGSIWPFILMILGAIGAFFVKYFFKPIKHVCKAAWHLIRR